jgi:hypothetical protein
MMGTFPDHQHRHDNEFLPGFEYQVFQLRVNNAHV